MALPLFEDKTSIVISMPKITTEWQRFELLGADGLYELLRFRQGIFVVEECSPFRDLDGLDLEARHLLLRAEGALVTCCPSIEASDSNRPASPTTIFGSRMSIWSSGDR